MCLTQNSTQNHYEYMCFTQTSFRNYMHAVFPNLIQKLYACSLTQTSFRNSMHTFLPKPLSEALCMQYFAELHSGALCIHSLQCTTQKKSPLPLGGANAHFPFLKSLYLWSIFLHECKIIWPSRLKFLLRKNILKRFFIDFRKI